MAMRHGPLQLWAKRGGWMHGAPWSAYPRGNRGCLPSPLCTGGAWHWKAARDAQNHSPFPT